MPSPLGPDDATGADASRREFLAKVEAILRTLPVKVDVAFGELETAPDTAYRWGPPAGARGLIVRSPDGLPSVDGVAQVVAASVLDEGDAYEESGARLTRERSLAFEALPVGGRAVYRLYILENPWEARGHGRWSPPTRVLESEDPAEIAMGIAAWANHSAGEPVIHPPRTAVANRLHRQLEARRIGLRDLEVVADVGPAELLEAASEPVLEHVNRRLLLWHFPRDQRGRLQARAVVLLSCLRTAASPQARELWLCAEGPANAPASQQIHLRLRWEHGANQDHRWDDAPHLWDTRCQASTLESRWGIDNRSRADRSADHMEAGRLGEGLEVYGIELSPEANEVAHGRMPWSALRPLIGGWSETMRIQLAGAAPWLLAAAAHDARVAKAPLRLFGLGGQNIARKPGLFLAGGSAKPRLEIHWSASNARLPLVRWRRPADYDLLRLGLVGERELLDIGRE